MKIGTARWRRTRLGLIAALAAVTSSSLPVASAGSPDEQGSFEAVRKADLDLAAVGWRLATANAALCDRHEPGTGLQLHTLDQFGGGERDDARVHFGFRTPVAIEGIVPGSPAERAGLRQDDSVVRIGGLDVARGAGKAGTTDRLVSTQLFLAELPVTSPVEIEVLRGGEAVRATIQPVPACRSRFELKLSDAQTASADGTMVQISSAFLERYPADQFAAVVAHEFSHNILRHRVRLEARGVSFGLLSGLGGNVKYFRQTEIEADLLSLYLLTNAGMDAGAGPAFWRKFGPSGPPSFLRSRSHPHWKDRAATMEAEIGKITTSSARPIIPALVQRRGEALTGDWQSLLVRSR